MIINDTKIYNKIWKTKCKKTPITNKEIPNITQATVTTYFSLGRFPTEWNDQEVSK